MTSRGLVRGALIAAAFLGALELALRWVAPPPEYFFGHPFDVDLGFHGTPNLRVENSDPAGPFPFELNRQGFRGPLVPSGPAAESDAFRILFLGDSFLVGWTVRAESLIPFVAERHLIARGLQAKSFNVSGDGFGTVQQLILFRRHVGAVRPDFVVLCLFAGNDLSDNSLDLVGRTLASPGGYVRPYLSAGGSEVLWLHPWRAWLRRRSSLYQRLEHRLLASGWIDSHSRAEGALLQERERIAAGLLPRAYLNVFSPQPDPSWEAAWSDTAHALRQLQLEVESHGARLLVVVIPHKFQVQRDAILLGLESKIDNARGQSMSSQLDWNLPEARLASILGDSGIETLFLVDGLREETARRGRSLYLHDGHLSGEGHRLAGAEIGESLLEMARGGSPASDRPSGRPYNLLGHILEHPMRIDFSADPRPELLGQGWQGWSGDWWGQVSGWAMAGRGSLVVPNRRGEIVLRGWLPEFAEAPVEIRIDGAAHEIRGTGHFELRQKVRPMKDRGAVRQIGVRASRTYFLWQDADERRSGLILREMAFVESGQALRPEP